MARITRRRFVGEVASTASVVSIGATAPGVLLRTARAASESSSENVLVVLQMSGGNDGLNTIVPFRDDAYRDARPTLALSPDEVLAIDGDLALHPALDGLEELLENGELGVLQGVGYPNPNRSHFESMDIWHTCRRKGEVRTTGWLGRLLDATETPGGSVPALHLGGDEQPLALAAERVRSASISTVDRFRLETPGDDRLETTVARLSEAGRGSDDLLSFVQSNARSALSASRRVSRAMGRYEPAEPYPETALARKLRTVAQLIDADFGARVYYVTLDGFDTHARQAAAHATLLRQWGDALATFVRDLKSHGHDDRVLTMTFSEFGRRLAENASGGTDHGAAAPMFFAGGRVQPGLIREHPSLTDLHAGDPRFHVDFRSAYAAVLEQWLRTPSAPIVGDAFEPAPILRTTS